MFEKKDADKPRLELVQPSYMVGIAQVLTFGAKKYSANNWKAAKPEDRERIKGAMLRHMMAYIEGEVKDPETGLSHLYHIGCNAMFLDYFDRTTVPHQLDFAEELQ